MKYSLAILYFLFLPALVFCQDKKITIGFTASPVFYSFQAEKGFNHEYTKKFSYCLGPDFTYHFGKRSAVLTGLFYSTIRYDVLYKFLFSQTGDPDIPRQTDATVHYIDIPLMYAFRILYKPKIELYLSAGLVNSTLIASDTKTTYEDNSVRSFSKNLNTALLYFQGSLAMVYNVTDRAGIELSVHSRFCNKGIDKEMNQQTKAMDLALGILFTLWKNE